MQADSASWENINSLNNDINKPGSQLGNAKYKGFLRNGYIMLQPT